MFATVVRATCTKSMIMSTRRVHLHHGNLVTLSTMMNMLPAKRFESSTSNSLSQTTNRNSSYPDNDPGTYRKARMTHDAEVERRLNHPNRFQSINDREERSDLPLEAFKINSRGRNIVTYKGCNILSSPEDYVLYHQLFWYVKPKTIIELGTCSGGSAIWFGDQLKLLEIPDGHVYTMDLDSSLLGERVKSLNSDNVSFLQGDCNEIEKTFTPEMLSKLPHPWVVVEDVHVNLSGTFGYLHRFLKEGDYFVVEDINPYIPLEVGAMYSAFESCPLTGTAKLDEFKDFFRKHDDYYSVDSFFTDFYGYNSSFMWHGFVRRMKN